MLEENKFSYRALLHGKDAEWYFARGLDDITAAGSYEVRLFHNDMESLGITTADCDKEHYVVAHLFVSESAATGKQQALRVVGQTLLLTICATNAVKAFTRTCEITLKGASWGSWVDLGAASTTDIQDGSITAQKLSTDVRGKLDRVTEVDEIKNNALHTESVHIASGIDEVSIGGRSINGEAVVDIPIPVATTRNAGVMSAEDKLKIEDTSKKTNNIRVVEASSETEEIVICNNDETEEIVKINNEGLTAKKIFNSSGEEIESSGMSVIDEDPATLEICDEKQRPILMIDSKGNINTSSFNSLNVAKNKFKGKTMLYIGDSISTGNIWHWKGYIKDCIGLNYVNYNINDTVSVTPAVGGITIIPHNDDDIRPMNAGAAEVGSGAKSIWWRCCNKRLGIYDFDYINLFGGTNDIYDNNLNVGTIDDAPLLDTDVEDLSTLDLSQVSFASAFMGCIEMLQRDFPGKQIFICTLLYNGYARTPDVVKIQMLAAQKYGLIVVPFYYSELNSQNYQWLCDGFHPKQVAARIMEKNFIEFADL